MACRCADLIPHIREDVAENYGATDAFALVRARAEGRERLYRCGECGAEFLQARVPGERTGEEDIVYFALPLGAAAGFDTLDARPLLRGYYRALLARKGPVEEEGECGRFGCAEPAIKGSAYCAEHLIAARAGRVDG
ncbi:MAG: hypothetical protein AABZ30_07960 [Myxococcota bacterium]